MHLAIPALRITDYEVSRAFYVDGLGFSIDWEWRHEAALPVFMQINKENLLLYLSQHEGDCQSGGLVYLYVRDVDDWYRTLAERGITVQHSPLDQPWGNREMRVRDPDNNCLCICTVKASQTRASAPSRDAK